MWAFISMESELWVKGYEGLKWKDLSINKVFTCGPLGENLVLPSLRMRFPMGRSVILAEVFLEKNTHPKVVCFQKMENILRQVCDHVNSGPTGGVAEG